MALDEVKIEHAGKSGGKKKAEDLEKGGEQNCGAGTGLALSLRLD